MQKKSNLALQSTSLIKPNFPEIYKMPLTYGMSRAQYFYVASYLTYNNQVDYKQKRPPKSD